MYKNKNGFSLKVFLIRGQNSICRNAKPSSRTTPIKKSVGNINKKFSLCFSLNIFTEILRVFFYLFAMAYKRKLFDFLFPTEKKKTFQLAIVCEDKLYFYGRFRIIICNFAHRLKWCDYYSTVHFRNYHPSWLFHIIIFCSSLSFRGVWVCSYWKTDQVEFSLLVISYSFVPLFYGGLSWSGYDHYR